MPAWRKVSRGRRRGALLALGMAIFIVGGVTMTGAQARDTPTFPPQGARWNSDGSGLVGTYRLTKPRMGRKDGSVDNWAIRTWQELLTEAGYPVAATGTFDKRTQTAVRRFQKSKGLRATGRINYPTGKALLTPAIIREARRVGMSGELLCGHLGAESKLDVGAVGPDGTDIGVAQISMYWFHPEISVHDAFNEDFAIRYMAERVAMAYRKYGNWRIAVASYNNPGDAQDWYESGRPNEKMESYSRRAYEGCTGPGFPAQLEW